MKKLQYPMEIFSLPPKKPVFFGHSPRPIFWPVVVYSLALGGTREGVPPNQAYPPSTRFSGYAKKLLGLFFPLKTF